MSEYKGRIVIEWPPLAGTGPHGCLVGALVAVFDADTGRQITTVSKLTVAVDTRSLIAADLVMFADEDGEPVYDGQPRIKDGEVVTGTFPFLVAEMRVRTAA